MDCDQILAELEARASLGNVAGMARYGINPSHALGIPIPVLRALANKAGRDHALAQQLWPSGIHEARILAGFVEDPRRVSEAQMEDWVAGFDSWDVCDQVCANLFDRTPFAYTKAAEWARRQEEFARRAGFALMAVLARHDQAAGDAQFTPSSR